MPRSHSTPASSTSSRLIRGAVTDIEKSTLIQAFKAMGVFPDLNGIEREIAEHRRGAPQEDAKALSKRVVRATTTRMTGIGAVAALPGAVPGLGTATQLGVSGATLTAETWTLLRNLTAMQLTVAGLHGHDVRAPERLDELVIVWGVQTGAIVPATEAAQRIGTKIAVKQFNSKVSGEVFKRFNRRMTTTVLTKWGTKRGGIAVGRLVPFGVGSAVGGGMNYLVTRSFGRALLRYYSQLLPNDGDGGQVVIVE